MHTYIYPCTHYVIQCIHNCSVVIMSAVACICLQCVFEGAALSADLRRRHWRSSSRVSHSFTHQSGGSRRHQLHVALRKLKTILTKRAASATTIMLRICITVAISIINFTSSTQQQQQQQPIGLLKRTTAAHRHPRDSFNQDVLTCVHYSISEASDLRILQT